MQYFEMSQNNTLNNTLVGCRGQLVSPCDPGVTSGAIRLNIKPLRLLMVQDGVVFSDKAAIDTPQSGWCRISAG
jgi:hypothetical protein